MIDLQFVCRIRPAQRSSCNQRQRGTRPLSRRQKKSNKTSKLCQRYEKEPIGRQDYRQYFQKIRQGPPKMV